VAVRKHTGLVAGLSGWLATENLAASALSSEVAERFCAARRASGHTYLLTVKALDPLLGYLRGLGVAPPASPPACAGPVEELLSRYRRYLEQERGLVPAAARGYVDKVRPFVARFDAPDGLELWRVDVAEVRGFVLDVCPRLGRRSAQLTVVALRSLLRFLHLDGSLERSLAGAVPSIFAPRLSGLPKRLEAGQVDALLASCDSSTVIGVRDLAILSVLARLGLRAAEVAGLSLEDVDWRAGELVVRGKGGRSERLPLLYDVGRRSWGICATGGPEAHRTEPCSSGSARRTIDSRSVGSPMWLRRQRSEPDLGRFMRIDSGAPRRQRCFVRARRCRRSGGCSVTATRGPPRSTRRSIEGR
jgi:integrase/recombinase XerD